MVGQKAATKMCKNLMRENEELKERNCILEKQSEDVLRLGQQYFAKIEKVERAMEQLNQELSAVRSLKQEYKCMVERLKLEQADYKEQMRSLLYSIYKGVS